MPKGIGYGKGPLRRKLLPRFGKGVPGRKIVSGERKFLGQKRSSMSNAKERVAALEKRASLGKHKGRVNRPINSVKMDAKKARMTVGVKIPPKKIASFANKVAVEKLRKRKAELEA